MSDTLGCFVLRVPAGTSSTSNLFASTRALSAGAGHIFLTSDLNHAAMISAVRPVCTHQGFAGFYRGPLGGTPSSPPNPGDVVWNAPGLDAGAANLRVPLRVDTYGADALPMLRLRCWVQAPPSGTESVGVVLAVTPRGEAPTALSLFTSTTVTNTAGEDVDLEIQLVPEVLYATTFTPSLGYVATGAQTLGEPVAETVCTAWIGFYNTANKNSDTANVYGIVLSLEAP